MPTMAMNSMWCGWRDLNPHALRRQNLNLVRLPISPHPRPEALISKTPLGMRAKKPPVALWIFLATFTGI